MSTPEAQRNASKAYRKRLKEAGSKQIGFVLSPDALAALDKLAVNGVSKAQAVNAALISAAERLESGLVPIQCLDVDAEHRLAGPEKPERSSAKPSAAKVDGATPLKPKIDTSGVAVHPSLQKGKTK